jgi:hypothetical protein
LRFALDYEAALAHCGEMRTAGDEAHVVPGVGEPSAEESPHAARTHHRDFHDFDSKKIRPVDYTGGEW